MHQVTCTHCGRVVLISPDSPRCSICGQDLHTHIPEGYSAPYFYRRAADLAARGDLPSSLAEVERGLDHIESSELRLLAAIVAKRLGDMDTVRTHVAAIPVDDRLRQEAEWLLRSQLASRALDGDPGGALDPKPGTSLNPYDAPPRDAPPRPGQPNSAAPSPLEGTTHADLANPTPAPPAAGAQPATNPAKPGAGRDATQWAQRFWGVVALALVLIAGAMGWILLSRGPDALIALLPGLDEAGSNAIVSQPVQLQAVTPMPLVLPTPTPQGAAAAQPVPPTIPADFVYAATPQPVAGSGLAAAAGLEAQTIDLPALLVNRGRTDLAALGLRAEINGSSARVSGIVSGIGDRQEVLDLLASVPAVQEVNSVDLLVRIPATYTVAAGDSLWGIVSKFYGADTTRLTQLVELNSDALAGGQTLQLGEVLELPPLD